MRQSHTSFPLCHHILCFIWLPYSLSLSLFFFNNKMKCHCFSGKFENGFSDMFLHFFFWKGGGTHIDDHLRPSYLNKTCASHSRRVSPGAKKHCVDFTEVSCFGPRRAERPSKEEPLAIGHFRLLVLVKSYFRRREVGYRSEKKMVDFHFLALCSTKHR